MVGHISMIKLSDKDSYLLPYFLKLLTQFNGACAKYFKVVDKLKDFDAVIATGSNNAARYFENYFKDYPHIIRKNRNAVAILDGTETEEEIVELGQDVFQYFGLGCRNVSKIYVPEGYDFTKLLETFHQFNRIILHSKYKNNYDYNYALLMMNNVKYMSNGAIILKEDQAIQSRIATLHYEFYSDKSELVNILLSQQDYIQCVVSNKLESEWSKQKTADTNLQLLPLGQAQCPSLMDYADGVDTINFLLTL